MMKPAREHHPRALLCGQWFSHRIDVQGIKTTEYATMAANGSFEFVFSSLILFKVKIILYIRPAM